MAPLFRFRRPGYRIALAADHEARWLAPTGGPGDALEMQPCAGGLFLLEAGARQVPQVLFAG